MTRYAVCLEQVEGRWVGHVPALPGCFTSEPERAAAEVRVPAAIADYLAWRVAHGDRAVPVDEVAEAEVEEIALEWPCPADPEYMVNAFFASDAVPLSEADIAQVRSLLAWTRADLLASVADLEVEQLERPVEDDWSIRRILDHVGGAEGWYLSRLGLAAPQADPGEWRARLELARTRLLEVLPGLVGLTRLELHRGETWSARKMLRRALWHERDHTEHIRQFRRRLGLG